MLAQRAADDHHKISMSRNREEHSSISCSFAPLSRFFLIFIPPYLESSYVCLSVSRNEFPAIRCLDLANVKVHYCGLWKSFCSKAYLSNGPGPFTDKRTVRTKRCNEKSWRKDIMKVEREREREICSFWTFLYNRLMNSAFNNGQNNKDIATSFRKSAYIVRKKSTKLLSTRIIL